MKKTVLLFIISFLFTGFAYSQVSVGVGGGVGLPMGDFKDLAKTGFGFAGTVNYSMPASPVELSATVGYDMFGFSDALKASFGDYKFKGLTVLGGANYLFKSAGNMFTPYIGGKLGIMSQSSDAPGSTSTSVFTWSPQVGFRYGFSPTMSLDVNAHYVSGSKNGATTSWLGIQGGIVFGFQ